MHHKKAKTMAEPPEIEEQELQLFRNVQCDLGPNQRPNGIIYKLRDAVILYVVLRGKNLDRIPINQQVRDLVEDTKEVNRLRRSGQGKYKIRELPNNDNHKVKKKYQYMEKHWSTLSENDSSLQMTGKRMMSYTTFLQHQTRFKKIWFHTSLFLSKKCLSVEEICEKYKKCKKISDIEYQIQKATGHASFVTKNLTFNPPDEEALVKEEEEKAKRKKEEEEEEAICNKEEEAATAAVALAEKGVSRSDRADLLLSMSRAGFNSDGQAPKRKHYNYVEKLIGRQITQQLHRSHL